MGGVDTAFEALDLVPNTWFAIIHVQREKAPGEDKPLSAPPFFKGSTDKPADVFGRILG